MKKQNRSSVKREREAGHKLWRAVLRRKYGRAWRDYDKIG